MLRNYGVIEDDAQSVVEGYTKRDLALMGATFANAGVHPVTGQRVVTADVARQTPQ